MILHVYSVLNLLWFLCNSAVVNSMQLALYLFVRPFDTALHRRCMAAMQSIWVGVASSSFPETNLVVT